MAQLDKATEWEEKSPTNGQGQLAAVADGNSGSLLKDFMWWLEGDWVTIRNSHDL